MKILTHSYRIRLSKDDLKLINRLKDLRIKPTTFIRDAFREKLKSDLSKLIKEETKRKNEIKLPF